MRLHEIMSTPVEMVDADTAARDAWERMRQRRIHHLIVSDQDEIVGVISSRDLGGRHGKTVRDVATVRELMSAAPVVGAADMQVKQAANLMRGRSIGCLPVVNARGALVGIVTVFDLLEALGRAQERPVVQGKRWTLKHRGPRRAAGGR
jgi:acetoin utilization protein AcuB